MINATLKGTARICRLAFRSSMAALTGEALLKSGMAGGAESALLTVSPIVLPGSLLLVVSYCCLVLDPVRWTQKKTTKGVSPIDKSAPLDQTTSVSIPGVRTARRSQSMTCCNRCESVWEN